MTFDLAKQFSSNNIYLNTATVGLPCKATLDVMQQDLTNWQNGELNVPEYDAIINQCRGLFASLIHAPTEWVAVGNQLPALELIDSLGVKAIGKHNISLANRFRRGIGLDDSNSAIVSLDQVGIDEKLQAAGVAASARAGAARLSFHLYNTEEEVDHVLEILSD